MARPPSPARRSGSAHTLELKLDRLVARVGALEDRVRSLEAAKRVGPGVAYAGKRTLFKNPMTLSDALRKLLKGRTMRVMDAAEAVQKAGYRTISRTFQIQVRGILSNGPFKRVGRGVYTAK